jgi:hypothetical protein
MHSSYRGQVVASLRISDELRADPADGRAVVAANAIKSDGHCRASTWDQLNRYYSAAMAMRRQKQDVLMGTSARAAARSSRC